MFKTVTLIGLITIKEGHAFPQSNHNNINLFVQISFTKVL